MPPRPPTRRRGSPPPSGTIVPCVALAADLDGLPSIALVYGLETKKRAAACQHAIPAPYTVTLNDEASAFPPRSASLLSSKPEVPSFRPVAGRRTVPDLAALGRATGCSLPWRFASLA